MPNGKRIPLWAPIPGYPGYVASPGRDCSEEFYNKVKAALAAHDARSRI